MCLLILAAASCGSPTTPTPSTTFQGVIAGSNNQTGTLTVTVQAQVAAGSPSFLRWPLVATLQARATNAAATGSLHLAGGSTTSMTGTFDSSSKALTLSGSGFTLTGAVSSAVLTGTYTGPSGAAGAFSSQSTTGGTVTSYCGNVFSSGNANQVVGVFNLVVADATGAVSGAFTAPNAGYITGHVTGTALTITYTDAITGEQGTATGTVQNGAVSGVSTTNNSFSGSTSKCQ